MFRSRASSPLLAALAALAFGFGGLGRLNAAEPRLSVAGSVTSSPEFLDVKVDVHNAGDAPAASLVVTGELFSHSDEVRLSKPLAPGQTQSVLLRYALPLPRPGVHLLGLLLEYKQAAGPVSQRAYLLLSLGVAPAPAPAVRLSVPELSLRHQAALLVGLESSDGAPHHVRLRVLTPRALRAEKLSHEIEVPARGTVRAAVQIYRGDAPWGRPQGILIAAEAQDGALERAAVAASVVHVQPDPAWLPRLRGPLLILALLLLVAAVLAEYRRARYS